MEKVSNILNRKAPRLQALSPETPVDKALKQMCCENARYLPVIDENGNYIGMITEHEINAHILSGFKELSGIKVIDMIDNRRPHVTCDDTVDTCMQLMSRHRVQHIPVFDGLQFAGIISMEDIIDEAVANRKEIFDEARAGMTTEFIL